MQNLRFALLASILFACSSPPVAPAEDGGPGDAGTTGPGWTSAPDYPVPIAFGAILVLPANGTRYVFVIGGAGGAWGALGAPYAQVRRAEILADHSLGPWEDSGNISTAAGTDIPLMGHGAIPIHGETGMDGVAIAGGETMGGADLPLVLVSYIDDLSGLLSGWGRFEPMLMPGMSGQGFGSWDVFEAHQLALVGGMEDGVPTARVIIAPIMDGSMSPVWVDGVPLPQPRYGHASVRAGGEIFLIGGANVDGTRSDILHTTRSTPVTVDGYTRAGLLPMPTAFPGACMVENRLYVIGGVEGDLTTQPAVARVLVATIDTGLRVGDFAEVPDGALPAPVAAPLVAVDGNYAYVVGGITGDDLHAVSSVYWGRLP